MSLSYGQLELFTESSDVVIVILETPHETSIQYSEGGIALKALYLD